jgi:hypothetical protein
LNLGQSSLPYFKGDASTICYVQYKIIGIYISKKGEVWS